MVPMRLRWFSAALLLSAALAILHSFAVAEFLYWRFEWIDVPMHFLGGLTIGTLIIAFWYRRKRVRFLFSAIAAFVGWEVFEYAFGVPREANYVLDTALDLMMDTLGALVAYTIARLTLWR